MHVGVSMWQFASGIVDINNLNSFFKSVFYVCPNKYSCNSKNEIEITSSIIDADYTKFKVFVENRAYSGDKIVIKQTLLKD